MDVYFFSTISLYGLRRENFTFVQGWFRKVRSRILESKWAVYDGPIRSYVRRKLTTYCAVGPSINYKVAEFSLYVCVCVCGAVSLFVKGRQFRNYDRRKCRQLQRYALKWELNRHIRMSTAGMMGIYQGFRVLTLCCCVSGSRSVEGM